MAITKTKFINYLRCPRYAALDNLKKDKLMSDVSYAEYEAAENETHLQEILETMFDDEGNDLIDVEDKHLETMLSYYNKVEMLAGSLAPKYFNGTFKLNRDTKLQESFDTAINGIRYICYVDIYNEEADHFNIIEVKATTTSKFLKLGKTKKKIFYPLFKVNERGIYIPIADNDDFKDLTKEEYYQARQKLYNRFDGCGHYVYDLAVQRYIIEHDLASHGQATKIDSIHYYLAVLNHQYEFDGTYDGVEPVYHTDEHLNDIVCFFDMTSITKDYMDIIDNDRKRVESYVTALDAKPCPLSLNCERKRTTKCKFIPICYQAIPTYNSLFNYLDISHGFQDQDGTKHDVYDLVNDGYQALVSLPDYYLTKPKQIIQKQACLTHQPYLKLDRIKAGIEAIHYPIYHFDYETFPCPLPRFKGEHCYTQSTFQFSLHIEKTPGVCDKEQDHYGFLATDATDQRLELVKKMMEWIDTDSGGSIMVYNQSFEKTRMKELAHYFPEYSEKLLKMRDMVFDLMFVLKGNSSLYESLGFSDDLAMFNYYDEGLSGSFSIKKVLPLFSNLTYKGMEVANGTDAMITYANFPKMTPKDYEHKYQKLVEYCQQDTWAMVEILRGLRLFVKNKM